MTIIISRQVKAIKQLVSELSIQALLIFWDSCLHLIPAASRPQGVFGVPSRQKQMLETGVNAICGQVPDRVPSNEVRECIQCPFQ